MKKLSFIMAVLMILMCMPVMAMPTVSATEPEADESDPVVDLTIPEDCKVAKENSIGYVLDNGVEVPVATLTAAADIARAKENIGKQVILYLTKDYEAAKTIGYAYSDCESVYLSGGADLVIDGQGLYSIVSVMTGSNPGRLFRFNDDENNDGTGSLTFRNITLNTGDGKAGGNLEFSAGSLKLVTFKNAEIITPTINNNNFCFVVKTNIVLDNVTRADCKSRPALYLDGTLTADIKNFTVNNVNAVVMSNTAGNITLNIDGLTATNVNYNVIEQVKGSITVKNATATVNHKAFFDKITADISISDSTVNAPALCGETISGKVTVNNVNFNATKTTDMIAATSLIYNIDAEVVINSAVVSASALFNNVKNKVTVNNVTLTGAGIAFDNVAADVTVNSGNYTCSNMFAKLTGNGTTFTVKGGTFNDCSNGSNAAFRVQSSNNTINLYDGTFNIAQYGIVHMQDDATGDNPVDYTKNNNTVNIYGGTYTIATPVDQIGILDEAKDSSNSTYNIYGGTFTMAGTGGRMFVFNDGSTNTTLNITGGTFTAARNIFSLRNAPNLKLAINGGVFTTTNGADEMFWLNDGATKTITINDGTFNALNRTGEANDSTIKGSAGDYAQGINGIIYSVSAGAAITINGGSFNLCGENAKTVVDGGVHLLTRGNAKSITVLGGTFSGGQYVNVHAPKVDLSAATKAAMPEGKNTVTLNPTTTKGASVRTVTNDSGIRFQGTVSQYSMDFLKTFYADKNVYCGVAVIPEAYLESTNGVFTFEALKAADCIWATTNATNGLIDNEDGTYTVRLALTNIGNVNMKFVAIAYVYADVDGNGEVSSDDAVIYAGNYSNARSIVETATAALADVKASPEGKYTTQVEIDGVIKYSRYSENQIAELRKYAN